MFWSFFGAHNSWKECTLLYPCQQPPWHLAPDRWVNEHWGYVISSFTYSLYRLLFVFCRKWILRWCKWSWLDSWAVTQAPSWRTSGSSSWAHRQAHWVFPQRFSSKSGRRSRRRRHATFVRDHTLSITWTYVFWLSASWSVNLFSSYGRFRAMRNIQFPDSFGPKFCAELKGGIKPSACHSSPPAGSFYRIWFL